MLSRILSKGVNTAAKRSNIMTASRRTFASDHHYPMDPIFTQPNKYIFYGLTTVCVLSMLYGQVVDTFEKKTYSDAKVRLDKEVKMGKRNLDYTINKDFYIEKQLEAKKLEEEKKLESSL